MGAQTILSDASLIMSWQVMNEIVNKECLSEQKEPLSECIILINLSDAQSRRQMKIFVKIACCSVCMYSVQRCVYN